MKEAKQALPLLDKYISKNKENAYGYRQRAFVWRLLKQDQKADKDIQTANFIEEKKQQKFLQQIKKWRGQKKYDKALEELERSLEKFS